jgi:mono/diheme cytochrome c family protein
MTRCFGHWLALLATAAVPALGEDRVTSGLVALYDFEEGAGTTIRDRASAAPPVDLRIETPRAVRWKTGAIAIDGSGMIASATPAKKIVDAVKSSGAISIEAWLKPENATQSGPARIVSLSADPGNRNFTLGQDASKYDVRLRTDKTGENGVPSLAGPDNALTTDLTHVVYTRNAEGKATIVVNGKAQVTAEVAGSLGNWAGDFRLLLANERTGDRPWRGELHLLAIYDRALSSEEIVQNFKAGASWAVVDYTALLPPAADHKVDFGRDVQPVFRAHCYECHSAENEEGGLNLGVKSRALEGGEHGPVFSPGRSAASRLIHLVAGIEKDGVMPPKDKPPLSKHQIAVLRAWIDQGAEWPAGMDVPDPRVGQARTHWAFQPLRAVEPPTTKDKSWIRTPIDRFILAALEAKGLTPSPPADSETLLRRVSFDVAGLPPSLLLSIPSVDKEGQPEQQRAEEKAYEEAVDRLLASRHYGERWGRHWLDVARYADSDGYESDADRPHAYQYRDFVIRALNEDLPADTFLRWQLAGDEIEPRNPEAVAATGFLTAAAITILPPTHLEEERLRNRYNELDDQLSTIGTAMLGLTLGCARCHNHKYDAISSREYYRLLASLHSGDRQVVKLPERGSQALVFQDQGSEPQATWLFSRGDFYDRDQPVQLGFLDVLLRERTTEDYWMTARCDPPREGTTFQRKALAAWITDVKHGAGALAARVLVNRVWQHHFGEGLVRTVSDFGVRSDEPSHPELLEWLASDFVDHGWKLKRLHKQIMMSAVYRQGDQRRETEKEKDLPASSPLSIDPENRLLWHKPQLRLEAEALRDAMLAAAGTLNLEPFGPAFKPPIPAEAMVARNTKSPYPTDAKDDASTHRRSVYMFHKRVVPYPLLQAFDRPDAQQACGRRDQTTVAPQALSLLNDAFVRARAIEMAERLIEEGSGQEALVRRSFEITLSRTPSDSERSAAIDFLKSQTENRLKRDPGKPAAEIRNAAVADLCQSLFSTNEFLYID